MDLKAVVYFAAHRLIGSNVGQQYQEMLDLETASPHYLEQLQTERLNQLLQHAVRNVPFYRQRLSKPHISLEDFPILTKEIVRESFSDLMTDDLRAEVSTGPQPFRYSWTKVQSGGTTGVPTTVIHDRECRDGGRAGRLYSQWLCGFPLGTPYLRLWGSMHDINQMRDSLPQRALHRLHGETVLNAFRMNDDRIAEYIHVLNRRPEVHLMGYVDAIAQVANFARSRGIHVRPMRSIMACAGTVTHEMRNAIESVFHARVHNQYGSRECAGIACECDRGGHHIYANRVALEVVDEVGKPVPNGQSGRLLITLLQNRGFSMIRYEIGDIGAISAKACSCGRPYPMLHCVEGRASEFLRSTDGGYVSPVYIRHLIGVVHNPGFIRRFQLEQMAPGMFALRYERTHDADGNGEPEAIRRIERDLRVVLGTDCRLEIMPVAEIETTRTGKFLYTKRSYSDRNADRAR